MVARRPLNLAAAVLLVCAPLLAAAGAGACGEGVRVVDGPHAHIAEVHMSKCGACHRRVDPGTRTRPVLEAALVRHRPRVALTDAEWAELLEYLSDGGP